MLNDNNNESYWDVISKIMFLPVFFCFGIPLIIFISLFFIPEGYTGFTESTRTMNGTYQNKWLFDTTYVGTLILAVYIHINAFFNKNYHQYRYKLTRFLKRPESDSPEGNPKVFRVIFYFMLVMYLIMMNIGAPDGSRWTGGWNGWVFLNFCFYVVIFYFAFLFLGLLSFISKADLHMKHHNSPQGDKQ